MNLCPNWALTPAPSAILMMLLLGRANHCDAQSRFDSECEDESERSSASNLKVKLKRGVDGCVRRQRERVSLKHVAQSACLT